MPNEPGYKQIGVLFEPGRETDSELGEVLAGGLGGVGRDDRRLASEERAVGSGERGAITIGQRLRL